MSKQSKQMLFQWLTVEITSAQSSHIFRNAKKAYNIKIHWLVLLIQLCQGVVAGGGYWALYRFRIKISIYINYIILILILNTFRISNRFKPKKTLNYLLNRNLFVPGSVSFKILSKMTILDITLIKQDSKSFLPPNLFSLLNSLLTDNTIWL